MKMKLVSFDGGRREEVHRSDEWAEPRGLQTLHHEVAPGCFLFITLSPAGLAVSNGSELVAIPLREIVKLAQGADPAFRAS